MRVSASPSLDFAEWSTVVADTHSLINTQALCVVLLWIVVIGDLIFTQSTVSETDVVVDKCDVTVHKSKERTTFVSTTETFGAGPRTELIHVTWVV